MQERDELGALLGEQSKIVGKAGQIEEIASAQIVQRRPLVQGLRFCRLALIPIREDDPHDRKGD